MIDHPHAIFSCSACGKVAARVELVPPGETTTDPEIPSSATDSVMDAWRLVVDGPPRDSVRLKNLRGRLSLQWR